MTQIDIEQMNDVFTKFHLRGPWPFHPTIHRFSAPDHGDPHDHPWTFRSIILHGGYREQIFFADGAHLYKTRRPGDSFMVPAGRVHRIVELLEPECFTLILPHAGERKWGFYQMRGEHTLHRFHDETGWRTLAEAEREHGITIAGL